ncbi:apurinic/apyrimidinic endonuclease Apn1, putative [Plasmodium sp. gorilla clade G2]|uniref:apurinic/apyrimidinic endonuclease Apn1, putative n=1 Tax=Plasmodium sp. gorilla clade G2 TaxID=880535 RepID=UPI000D20A73C|nr:apurinic/apyrimidinic endonuclease Apn1, putative [Plasmodium sp. gorilla clade G2]SOV17920.1 apurinic/apyrimidinic endonuclease Apn1, putative [Plasmodium sp. gorilla clade G2]
MFFFFSHSSFSSLSSFYFSFFCFLLYMLVLLQILPRNYYEGGTLSIRVIRRKTFNHSYNNIKNIHYIHFGYPNIFNIYRNCYMNNYYNNNLSFSIKNKNNYMHIFFKILEGGDKNKKKEQAFFKDLFYMNIFKKIAEKNTEMSKISETCQYGDIRKYLNMKKESLEGDEKNRNEELYNKQIENNNIKDENISFKEGTQIKKIEEIEKENSNTICLKKEINSNDVEINNNRYNDTKYVSNPKEVTNKSIEKKKENKSKQTKKEIEKKKNNKIKSEQSTNDIKNIPPIPKNIEDRWNDYNKIKEYAKISNVYLGAHISASGGVQNAPINSFNISGLSFALFLKNQRKWESAALTYDNIKQFEENCKKYNFDKNFILPHGSYLINLANPDKEKRDKSYMSFLDDIKRCEQLNIKLYNFHPGSTVGQCTVEQGIKNVADCINKAHKETNNVIIVLENSAGQKNSVGSKFEHLRDIINLVHDKERIGVCLDTCHTFAAGYNIKTYDSFDQVMKQFDDIVNVKYLKAVHLNDSKSDLGSGLDRHENIGKGKLTMDTFKYIMKSKYFKNIPIILETPDITNDESIYKYEIQNLYKLYFEK